MDYVIGLDGGGTKTLLRLAALDKRQLSEVRGDSSNICSNKLEAVEKNIRLLITQGIERAGVQNGRCAAICLGTAGEGREGAKELLTRILADAAKCNNTTVVGDHETALIGAIGNKPGVIVIAGTGAICYGRDGRGNCARCGGWGHLIGDEGSAYYIAVRGLRESLQAFDGRSRNNLMLPFFLERAGISDVAGLLRVIYSEDNGKQEIAKLAKAVDEAADRGDLAALGILEDAGRELFYSCSAVARRLGLSEKGLRIVLSGSVITGDRYVRSSFERSLKKAYPDAVSGEAENDAAWGAVYMALDKLKRN